MKHERDYVDLIREKNFIGQEFLTWLWYRTDALGDTISLQDGNDAQVLFERFMILEGGEGDSYESVTCRGLRAELQEAKTALQAGKKVSRAHIRLNINDLQWKFTIDAATLDISSLKVPKTVSAGEEEGDDLSFEARVLERTSMLEQVIEAMDALFAVFLKHRLDHAEWTEEKRGIKKWIFRT